MQSLAFLWFQLQMTQRYLHEKTFGPAQSPANSANLNTPIDAITLSRASVKQLPPMASAIERRVRAGGASFSSVAPPYSPPVRNLRSELSALYDSG